MLVSKEISNIRRTRFHYFGELLTKSAAIPQHPIVNHLSVCSSCILASGQTQISSWNLSIFQLQFQSQSTRLVIIIIGDSFAIPHFVGVQTTFTHHSLKTYPCDSVMDQGSLVTDGLSNPPVVTRNAGPYQRSPPKCDQYARFPPQLLFCWA